MLVALLYGLLLSVGSDSASAEKAVLQIHAVPQEVVIVRIGQLLLGIIRMFYDLYI